MKNAYIVHGRCDQEEFENMSYPSGSNAHWLPWLQKKLIIAGYNCQTPEMPTPYKPSYYVWKTIFENYPFSDETKLIAHSAGCGFLLRYLAEQPKDIIRKIKKLLLWHHGLILMVWMATS